VPEVQRSVLLLYVVNERWVGWAGLAAVVAVGAGGLAAAGAARLGAAPGLAFGAAAAVFGLALGDEIGTDVEVGLTLVTLGLAFGALVVGGGLVVLGLPGRLRRWTAVAWALPLLLGWLPATWVTLHNPDEAGLALHPPVVLLAAVTGLVVLWSSVSVLMLEHVDGVGGARSGHEAGRSDRAAGAEAEADWSSPWFVLLAVGVVPGLMLMVLGFDPDVPGPWARASSLLTAAVVALGLASVARWLPHPVPQAAYLGIVTVLTLVPTALQLALVTTDAGEARVTLLGVLTLVGLGVAGAGAGYLRPEGALPLGLLVAAGGAAGAWVLPDTQWPMIAGAGFVVAGAAATLVAGARLMVANATAWRFVTCAALVALIVGMSAQVPMSWALGGAAADAVGDARAAGRIALGIVFVAAVLAAAVTGILLDRARPDRERHDPPRHDPPRRSDAEMSAEATWDDDADRSRAAASVGSPRGSGPDDVDERAPGLR
jgi:hypothetical protein